MPHTLLPVMQGGRGGRGAGHLFLLLTRGEGPGREMGGRAQNLQNPPSRTVCITTKVDVLATCGRLEIFSPSTRR